MLNNNHKIKIFIGYSNTAGNASILAKVLKKLGYNTGFYYRDSHVFGYDEEILGNKIFLTKNGKVNRLLFIIYAVYFILRYHIFIFSGHSTLLPSHIDVKLIKMLKKKIIFQFTGCDARDYRWFLESYEYKYNICKMCTDEYKKFVNCKIEIKIKNVKLAEKYGDLIIAHPHYAQLFTKKYEHFWVPIDVNVPADYVPSYKLNESDTLKIMHGPSNIDIKGTKFIEKAIEHLKSEGYNIEYERIQNLSNKVVLEKIMECDLAIDQLYEFHGLFGVEAMKYSKPIICYVDKFILHSLPENLPIIDANPDNLYDILKRLYKNRKELEYYGKKSREYVLEHHDAEKVISGWIDMVKK